jgi:putative membrane protein
MKEQEVDWSLPQRQSPAAIFIAMVKVLLNILKVAWPVILLYFLRTSSKKGDNWEIYLALIGGITIIGALIQYFFFRFSIINNELIIKEGLFFKKTTVLPLNKIQAVHIDRTWLHNLFKCGRVSFDSAGSEKIEIKLHAIEIRKAETLKAFITGVGIYNKAEPEKKMDESLFYLGMKDLLKLCFSANHLEAFFILLAFVFSIFNDIEQIVGQSKGFWQWMAEFLGNRSTQMILVLIIVILLLSIMISVVRILLRYADFHISRSQKGFHIRTGLINVKEKLVPYNKVQFISWRANLIRLKLNLYLLNFHSIGSGHVKNKQEIKVPVTRMEFIPLLVQFYHTLLPAKDLSVLRIHPAYIFHKTLLSGIIPGTILSIAGYFILDRYSFLFLLLIPLAVFQSWLYYRKFNMWANDDIIQVRKGVYGLEELILKWKNIQMTRMFQSPYQRQKKLATVKIYTAGGTVVIPYITYQQAMELVNFGLFKIETNSDLL